MNKIILNNERSYEESKNLYYPRLQVNKHGEIVLSVLKEGSLTTGILVGKLSDSQSRVPIGKKFVDWEVAGELVDYNGDIEIRLTNKIKKNWFMCFLDFAKVKILQ